MPFKNARQTSKSVETMKQPLANEQQRIDSSDQQSISSSCISPYSVVDLLHSSEPTLKHRISNQNDNFTFLPSHTYTEDSSVITEDGLTHFVHDYAVPDSSSIKSDNTDLKCSSVFGSEGHDRNTCSSWSHLPFDQSLPSAYLDKVIDKSNTGNTMTLPVTASCTASDRFSSHIGNEGSGLDDLVSKIVDDDQLNNALLQEHAELFGLTLRRGLMSGSSSNLSSLQNNLWTQTHCNNSKRDAAEYTSICDLIENFHIQEKERSQHLDSNLCYNSCFGEDNGNFQALAYQQKMHQKNTSLNISGLLRMTE